MVIWIRKKVLNLVLDGQSSKPMQRMYAPQNDYTEVLNLVLDGQSSKQR